MTVAFFAIVIALAALLQRTDARFYAALAYAIVNLAHYLFIASWVGDAVYYVSAGVANWVIMEWLMKLTRVTDTVVSLLRVCLAELCTNIFGGLLWWHGYGPEIYDWIFVGLYAWVILILLRKDKAHDPDRGGFEVGSRFDYLRLITGTGHTALSRRGG